MTIALLIVCLQNTVTSSSLISPSVLWEFLGILLNLSMCNDLDIDKKHLNYILQKVTTIIIRFIYYIFCMRNKIWTNPDLLVY